MACSNSTSHDWRRPSSTNQPREFEKQYFDSVWEWLLFLETPANMTSPRMSQKEGVKANAYIGGGGRVLRPEVTWKDWSGTDTLDEALLLAKRGWPEGLDTIEKYSAELSEELIGLLQVHQVTYDVVGDELDVGRHVNDEPEQFMTLVPEEIESSPQLLKMGINFGASQGVPAKTMMARGASIVALIDTLERHGKRVQIDAIVTAFNDLDVNRKTIQIGYGNPREMDTGMERSRFRAPAFGIETRIRLKEFMWPLQTINLVFVLAHPSAQRRLAFCSWEHAEKNQREWLGIYEGGEYGYPADLSDQDKEDFDIYIPSLSTTTEMRSETAIKYVLSELSKQGIYAEKEAKL